MDRKKVWKKTGFGVLFVAACFAAMYILMAFYGNILMVSLAAVVLLITAFLFLNEVFSDKSKKWMQQGEEEQMLFNDAVSSGTDGEFQLKLSKHMKEMESTQKELIDVLKSQNVLLQSQMENMEQAIIMLSEKQSNQTKSVIKFNKENARQLAISERETLEYVMSELKQTIENNAGATVVRMSSEDVQETPVLELEEVEDEELFEVSDLPGDEEYAIPDVPVLEDIAPEEPEEEIFAIEEPEEEMEIPDMPDDIDLSALFEDMAAGAIEEAAAEEPVAEEPVAEEPAADPLAGLGGDPNAMMTPEDIAKLLASMGQ